MLRPLHQALDPDPRFGTSSNASGTGPITFADHYDAVASVSLPVNAPQAARVNFSRALNCLLYAWFDYELMPLAEGQALAAVENAMRSRVGPLSPKTQNLKVLFDVAYSKKILTRYPGPEPSDTDFVVMMRNEFAHGSTHTSSPPMVFRLLEICLDIINELYPADSASN